MFFTNNTNLEKAWKGKSLETGIAETKLIFQKKSALMAKEYANELNKDKLSK